MEIPICSLSEVESVADAKHGLPNVLAVMYTRSAASPTRSECRRSPPSRRQRGVSITSASKACPIRMGLSDLTESIAVRELNGGTPWPLSRCWGPGVHWQVYAMLNNRSSRESSSLRAGLEADRYAWAIRPSTCSRMNQYRPLLPLRPRGPCGITMSKGKLDVMMILRTYAENIAKNHRDDESALSLEPRSPKWIVAAVLAGADLVITALRLFCG